MGGQAGRLSWRVEGAADLDRTAAGNLRDAVSAAEHWLTALDSVVGAALARDLILEVTVTGDDDGPRTEVAGPDAARIVLPRSLVGADAGWLRVSLLDSALAAVAAAAAGTAGQPAEIWRRPDDHPDDDGDTLGEELDALDPEDILVAGRLDGTPADELARFHRLDDYVVERVEGSGVAEVVDAEAGCAGASWQVRLTRD